MNLPARIAAICIASVTLVACGNEKSEPSPIASAMFGLARTTIARVSGKVSSPTRTASAAQTSRAELDSYGISILRVVIKSRAADALVTVTDKKGDVVTWSTTDGTTFVLREGVLVQTRGIGPDLMSAAAPWVADLRAEAGIHKRSYFFLGEDDQTNRRDYDCTMSRAGIEIIEVFERQHRTTHLKETCVRAEGKITNDFWLEGSIIRKSRQWASPGTGYIEFELAVD